MPNNLNAIILIGYRVQSRSAAKITQQRADSQKAHMGLINWRGPKVRKLDIVNSQNYLATGLSTG